MFFGVRASVVGLDVVPSVFLGDWGREHPLCEGSLCPDLYDGVTASFGLLPLQSANLVQEGVVAGIPGGVGCGLTSQLSCFHLGHSPLQLGDDFDAGILCGHSGSLLSLDTGRMGLVDLMAPNDKVLILVRSENWREKVSN
ncbi:unnamed protein product [Cuscuta europaea]|uniref:Uncharacterized protein n=1 Tax=Cuscuta europaea TaxID=41803 RepID=A0A9P0ZUM9_CUSEU|nr:unnamed protein product [Cuscuta europaea]